LEQQQQYVKAEQLLATATATPTISREETEP